MAYSLQPWNWLKNKKGEDDKMFREVWKAVETKVGKVRVAETKRKREKGEERNEMKSEFIFLERKQVRESQQISYGIIQ